MVVVVVVVVVDVEVESIVEDVSSKKISEKVVSGIPVVESVRESDGSVKRVVESEISGSSWLSINVVSEMVNF